MLIRDNVPLASYTTLALGGPARHLVAAESEAEIGEALAWAAARGLPVALLGGGSNLVVSDAGFPGLVLQLALRGLAVEDRGDEALLTAQAGEPWDEVVQRAVALGLQGIECLSGIPGSTGATPIQNVGAYGQEVADTIRRVRVIEAMATGACRGEAAPIELAAADCGFGYRDSRFKREPGRHVVLSVTFALRRGAPGRPAYAELQRALSGQDAPPIAEVRRAVLELRRGKSMVLDPADENRRSVGSFFMNPVVPAAQADAVVERALALGVARAAEEVPRHPAPGGQVKLAAAWLIERAGVRRGERRGSVGVSSRHALALVHHGGGRSADLVALARAVQGAVQERFGVTLRPEPVFLGFDEPPV